MATSVGINTPEQPEAFNDELLASRCSGDSCDKFRSAELTY